MFFAAKCVFWLSVVAIAMPGADEEAARARGKIGALAALAAPVAAAALHADLPGVGAAGVKCIAAEHCRAVLTELIRASLAEDEAPGAAAKAKPARLPAPAPAAKTARPQTPRA